MDNLSFDRRIAGAKTFWIIHFKNENSPEGGQKSAKPAIDFLIPSPLGDNQWMKAIDSSGQVALEYLNSIQKLCKDIKEECQNEVKKPEEFVDKAKKVSEDLSNLDDLIKHFNEIMRRFKNLPPEEKNDLNSG